MKRLSVCLLLLASCVGSFAACSSSDDSSSSGGSGGTNAAGHGGTSTGGRAGASGHSGHGGSHALSGAAGEAGESAGGAAGTEAGGAAGEANSAGMGGESGANAGQGNGGSSGSSSSAGGANGGSGGSNAGSGGISGQGANTGVTSQCGPAAQTAYANGIVAYFNAQVATSGCMPPQTHGMDANQTDECANSTCGATTGCSASFTWHDASYDAATNTFSVQVDIAAALAVTGAATCSLSDQVTGRAVTTALILVDNETSLGTSLDFIHAGGGTASATGCDTLTNVGDIAASDLDLLTATAEDAALTTLLTYSVDCTP